MQQRVEGHVAGFRVDFHATQLQTHEIIQGSKALLDVCEAISVPRSVNPGTASSVGRDSWGRRGGEWNRLSVAVVSVPSGMLRHRLAL